MQRVLVVDDEPAIVTLLTYNLEKANFEVDTATNGPDAVEMAKKKHFDAILLDLMLPGLDGMEVTKKLRQEKNEEKKGKTSTKSRSFQMDSATQKSCIIIINRH